MRCTHSPKTFDALLSMGLQPVTKALLYMSAVPWISHACRKYRVIIGVAMSNRKSLTVPTRAAGVRLPVVKVCHTQRSATRIHAIRFVAPASEMFLEMVRNTFGQFRAVRLFGSMSFLFLSRVQQPSLLASHRSC